MVEHLILPQYFGGSPPSDTVGGMKAPILGSKHMNGYYILEPNIWRARDNKIITDISSLIIQYRVQTLN